MQDSEGVTTKSYLPGKVGNMLSMVRHGKKFQGNYENVVMRYDIKADGKTFSFYKDWEMYLAELELNERCEAELWTGKYGKDENGEFYVYDPISGEPIHSGMGIDEQITNSDTFSLLTYNKMFNLIRDVTFNITAGVKVLEIYTGTGGMDDVDKMLTTELKGYTAVANNALGDQLVDGTGYNMVFGAYFKAFRHRDGHLITFIKNPAFDRGILGDVSTTHPVSGLPLSSHDFYFIDRSMYEGNNNLLYVFDSSLYDLSSIVNVIKYAFGSCLNSSLILTNHCLCFC